ncbi:MAG: hypothetical protein ABSE92_12550 [Terriglobales bacterium]|jgi:predicted anti-sigma-YlaC factor YlaD
MKPEKQELHERARMMIALGEEVSASEQAWLADHVEFCAACRGFIEVAGEAIGSMRTIPVTADVSLVSMTKARVRQRAQQLQLHQERLWVISMCCAAVTLGTAISTFALWQGFVWMGLGSWLQSTPARFGFVGLGFLALAVMPAVLAAVVLLAHGTHMADYNENYQG